jgi:hypothetical protein
MALVTRDLISYRESISQGMLTAIFRFLMGTSSTLFNGLLLQLNSSDADIIIVDALKGITQLFSDAQNDVSRVPNPFSDWHAQPNPVSPYHCLCPRPSNS